MLLPLFKGSQDIWKPQSNKVMQNIHCTHATKKIPRIVRMVKVLSKGPKNIFGDRPRPLFWRSGWPPSHPLSQYLDDCLPPSPLIRGSGWLPPSNPKPVSQVLDPALFRVNISETVIPQWWIQIKLRVSVIIVSSGKTWNDTERQHKAKNQWLTFRLCSL